MRQTVLNGHCRCNRIGVADGEFAAAWRGQAHDRVGKRLAERLPSFVGRRVARPPACTCQGLPWLEAVVGRICQ